MAKYDPAAYRNRLRMSRTKHLLVEGRDDKALFARLRDELFRRANREADRHSVVIDSAQDLIDFRPPIGNREKVEEICKSVIGESYAERLTGFVDREFREFELAGGFQDRLGRHNVLGRLVWSRGHSIENYYFDLAILKDALPIFSKSEYITDAMMLFDSVLESAIRVACACSLAAHELGILGVVGGVDWRIFKVTPSGVSLRFDAWKSELIRRKISSPQIDSLFERTQYWLGEVETADFEIVRWICHGHIGFAFIWAVFGCCVFHVCDHMNSDDPKSEAGYVQKTRNDERSNACAVSWVNRVLQDRMTLPLEVLQLLGIDVLLGNL